MISLLTLEIVAPNSAPVGRRSLGYVKSPEPPQPAHQTPVKQTLVNELEEMAGRWPLKPFKSRRIIIDNKRILFSALFRKTASAWKDNQEDLAGVLLVQLVENLIDQVMTNEEYMRERGNAINKSGGEENQALNADMALREPGMEGVKELFQLLHDVKELLDLLSIILT